ncbi:MAG: RNA methyltransferase [Chitinophagaceae bacterium]
MLDKSKIKYIQSLGQKKVRDEEGFFIAEGPKIVTELLAADNVIIKEIYALEEWLHDNPQTKKITVTVINEIELGKLSQLTTPNQVIAIVEKRAVPAITAAGKLSLVLDGLQDPGNLGTIIRIADWFDIEQVICSKDSADVYNPKVVQATMGSITRVNVLYTDIPTWLSSQKNIKIFATALDGEDISSMKKIKEGIILIGNESKGISHELMAMADVKITIGRKGKAESLNAAVATGIVLSHIV